MKKYIIIADWIINYISKEAYIFAAQLQEHFDWTIIKLSMLNIELLRQQKAIVLCITYDSFDISVLKCDNIILIYKIDDLYPYKDIRCKSIEQADLLIGPYQYLFKEKKIIEMYPSIKSKESYHIPYSAVNKYYESIEFNNNPIEKIFVSGALSSVYPFRHFIKNTPIFKEYIETLNHPTYKKYTHHIINDKYYKKLNNYLCCFTDASMYKYILLKVFEICSVGSLLLVDDKIRSNLENLGFYNNINCIMCNKDNLLDKIKWIIDYKNRQKVNTIRMNGMKLVREKHTVYNRAKDFNNIITPLEI